MARSSAERSLMGAWTLGLRREWKVSKSILGLLDSEEIRVVK